MSISLKAELESWAAALKAYDEHDFEKALDVFSFIADSSKILTNMGLIYATIGEHETAVDHFIAATNLDPYLAIAHFQCGVSNFLIERYDLALLNFDDASLYLRGNEAINYEQIGLKFKLFSAEIMFNRGLTQLNLGYIDQGMADLQEASRQQVTDEHAVIDEAIRDRGAGYTVFSIPVGILYRPSENKLKNSKSKDYLGKAKLVAASDSNDAFTEFTGIKKLQQVSEENLNKQDEDKSDAELSALSRSATLPVPRLELVAERRGALERSKTTPQPGAVVRSDIATILASRRTQSVSNPANVSPSPTSESPRNNTALSRSNTTRLAGSATAVVPLRAKTSQSTASGGVTGEEARSGATVPTALQPSLWKTAPVAQQSAPQPRSLPVPGQHVNSTRDVTPLALPAAPAPVHGGEHLTQFYDAYIDMYTDDPTLRSTIPRPALQIHPNVPLLQRRSPAASPLYQQPQEQPPPWTQSQSAPSPVRTRPGHVQPKAADMGTMESSMGKGGTLSRKSTRRTTTRRVMMYDGEEGDEFVANIRVKLHYQGDVRGMTIPPTMMFDEFVERVTTKFGTSLMGLGMKFVDEDGTKISLRDESDFELALETARDRSMEVWCIDTH